MCEYVGEILTDSDANKREDDCYLFDLDVKVSSSILFSTPFHQNKKPCNDMNLCIMTFSHFTPSFLKGNLDWKSSVC